MLGGALWLGSSGELNTVLCTFTSNYAEYVFGGAIYLEDGSYNDDSSVFTNNSAQMGGAFCGFSNEASFMNSSFFSNRAQVGAAVYLNQPGSDMYFVNCQFIGNWGQSSGAFFLISGPGTVHFNGCWFVDNQSDDYGIIRGKKKGGEGEH